MSAGYVCQSCGARKAYYANVCSGCATENSSLDGRLMRPPGHKAGCRCNGCAPPDPASRFERWVVREPSGCWRWTGRTNNHGYGVFAIRQRHTYAHRWSYEQFVGTIPAGLELDHLCRNPSCVNPAHLEAVSHRVNTLRGDSMSARHARRTHCNAGHEFTSQNTAIKRDGSRACRECKRATDRRRWQTRKAS